MDTLEKEQEVPNENETDFATDVDLEIDPSVRLKGDLDLESLRKGESTEFEIQEEDAEKGQPDYFDRKNIYKEITSDTFGGSDDDTSDDEDLSPFEKLARKMVDIAQDGSGLVRKRILRHGAGDIIPPSCYVRVHYNAYLEYADEPYDSSRLRNRPQGLHLGKGEMFHGFEVAVKTMRKGEEAQFLIAPEYGFGDQGCPPRIPGKAHLLFVIELLSVINRDGVDEYYAKTFEERRNCEWSLMSKVVREAKDRGKECFQRKNYVKAKGCYQQAASLLEQARLENAEDEKLQQAASLKVYLNIAVCCAKISNFNDCITFCRQALEIDKNCVKALYLMGKSYNQKSEFKKARYFLDRARRQQRNCQEINDEITKLNENMEKFRMMERDMCQRMFAQASNSMNVSPAPVSTSRQPTTTQECAPEFKEAIKEKLEKFCADSTLYQLPLCVGSYSAAELACVLETAADMGLIINEKKEGIATYLYFKKPQ